MPTNRTEARIRSPQYLYKSMQRFFMKKSFKSLQTAVIVQMIILFVDEMTMFLDIDDRTELILCVAAFLFRMSYLHEKMHTKRLTVMYPLNNISQWEFWDDNQFLTYCRFFKADFYRLIDAMDLRGKTVSCGRRGREQSFGAELCLMVVLRRLAYASRFSDMVDTFGLKTNRLGDIFYSTIDYLYFRYAERLNQMSIWTDFFSEFAQAFEEYGAPFENMIATFDGKFIPVCRPGGLGNLHKRMDQRELYSGDKAQHGIKFLVAQFPNGISALSGPYKGRVHDGRMLRESSWTKLLHDNKQSTGQHYIMYGDSGFSIPHSCSAISPSAISSAIGRILFPLHPLHFHT